MLPLIFSTTPTLLFNNAVPALTEWGTVARVPRISKPPTRSLTQPCLVSIHGLVAWNSSIISPPSSSIQFFDLFPSPPTRSQNCWVQAGRSQTSRWTCLWCPTTSQERGLQRHSRCSHPPDGQTSRCNTTTNLVGSNSCHLSLFTICLAVLCALDVNARLFLAADIFLRRPPSRRYETEECKEGCVDGLLWVGNLCGAELCSDIWGSKK